MVSSNQATGNISVEAIETKPVRRTMTMEEACRVIGIPRSSGYDLAANGRFPCRVLRIGARWYVPIDAVEELLSGRAA